MGVGGVVACRCGWWESRWSVCGVCVVCVHECVSAQISVWYVFVCVGVC